MANPLRELNEYGQSVWLDFVSRELLQSGGLARLIADDGVRGVTSNPSIFEKAIGHGDDYDELIRAAEAKGDLELAARAYGSIVDLFSNRADLRRFAGERLQREQATLAGSPARAGLALGAFLGERVPFAARFALALPAGRRRAAVLADEAQVPLGHQNRPRMLTGTLKRP